LLREGPFWCPAKVAFTVVIAVGFDVSKRSIPIVRNLEPAGADDCRTMPSILKFGFGEVGANPCGLCLASLNVFFQAKPADRKSAGTKFLDQF
jgi:hypothetical protein